MTLELGAIECLSGDPDPEGEALEQLAQELDRGLLIATRIRHGAPGSSCSRQWR